jgi:hypothetical protein
MDQTPTHNGGSGAVIRAVFVPLVAFSSPGYVPMDGQPAVYLCIAALRVNVLNCRVDGLAYGLVAAAMR